MTCVVESMEAGLASCEKEIANEVVAAEKEVVALEKEAAAVLKKEASAVETELADHEKEAFSSAEELGNGAIARLYEHHQVDWLALRLLKNHCVFSRDWKSDYWLHMKNKQLFLSLFLAHPKHPFRRKERCMALGASCILAWGMECWFCLFWTSCKDHSEKDFLTLFLQVLWVKILISAVGNGVYDAVLEQTFTCGCVQESGDCLKNSCEKLSLVQFWIQLSAALVLLGFGLVWLVEVGNWADFATATREMVVGKLLGALVITMLIETLAFTLGRKAQMKPTKDEALKKWNAPKNANAKLWNRFIGAHKTLEDLPAVAPTYDVAVKCCGMTLYRERADNKLAIPCCFRRKKVQTAVAPDQAKQVP